MSSKLDRSLDEILDRPRGGARGRGARASGPAGGIRKRSQRGAAQKANASITQSSSKLSNKAPPTGPSSKVTASKIIVSNLPFDVTEQMIKEYFQQVVGPIKRSVITYGPNGQSRGIATIEFVKPQDAATAAQKYNGVEVDKRPMKVELVVDPNAPASFADRIGAPKPTAAPRAAKADKPKPVAAKPARGRGRGRAARGGRGGSGVTRGKPKTAEQLDQEMADYFDGGATNTGSTAAPVASGNAAATVNGGDVGMDDNVL